MHALSRETGTLPIRDHCSKNREKRNKQGQKIVFLSYLQERFGDCRVKLYIGHTHTNTDN